MYDEIMKKIKNNRVISIIMVIATITTAVIGVYQVVIPIVGDIFTPKAKIYIKVADYKDKNVIEMINIKPSDSFHKYTMLNDKKLIEPDIDYFKEYNNDRFIKASYISLEPPEYRISPPVLDVMFENKSKNTIILDRFYLFIEKSEADKRPLVLVGVNEYLHVSIGNLVLFNDGWGEWEDCVISFNFVKKDTPAEKPLTKEVKYKYTKTIPYFEKYYMFNIKSYLKRDGIEIRSGSNDYIYKKSDSEWRDWQDYVKTEGLIAFRDKNLKTLYSINFFSELPLNLMPSGGGEYIAPTGRYMVKLKPDGNNYISELDGKSNRVEIKSGDNFSLFLSFGVDKTSKHRFSVIAQGNDGKEYKSDWYDMWMYIPRWK